MPTVRILYFLPLLTLSLTSSIAHAANYKFPGNLPSGCSGNSGVYSCNSLSLNYGDTIAIAAPKPATITVNGTFYTNNAGINAGGSAADLTLVVTGQLSTGYQAQIQANVTAGSVYDSGGGSVAFGGSLTTGSGSVSLGYQTTVAGSITSSSGNINVGQNGTVGGSISSSSGNITIGQSAVISGGITNTNTGGVNNSSSCSGDDVSYGINISQSATVGGNISSSSKAVNIGYAAQINGTISTTSGAVNLSQNGVVNNNITSSSGAVCVGYAATVNGSVASSGAVSLAQSAVVNGNIAGSTGQVSIGYGATVAGTLTTSSGSIAFAQNSSAAACVSSTSSARITLGYGAAVNSVCCGSSCSSSCVVNNSNNSMPPACAVGSASPLADFHLDEALWNGATGQVIDSAGGYNGASANLVQTTPTTANTAPAIANSPGTCGYGVFNRSNKDYIALPSAFPNLGANGGAFTITAWIKTTDNTQPGQRILIDDEHNTAGYGFSLGDGGTGMVRFFTRGAPSALILDTPNVVANNTWYFVAAVADVPNKTKRIYVYNTSGSLVSSVSMQWSESSFGSDPGIASIGGETNAATENNTAFGFSGNLDEVQVFTAALSQAGIQALFSQTHACPTVVTGVTPSSFNCVEVGAVPASNLYTKLAATAFSLDVVALTAGGSVNTGYVGNSNKNVTLELVDGSGGTACANRSVLSSALTQTVSFAASNNGRKTVAIGPSNYAYPDVRCRITDANQSPSVVSCSSDDFAIRPSAFSLSSTNATADYTASPNYANAPTLKTGGSFNLTAAADAAGYNGTPKLDGSQLAAHSGAVQTGTLTGSFNPAIAASGVASGNNFTYSEVGYFALKADGVYDDSFTAIDSLNGDCTADFSVTQASGKYGCKFGNTALSYFGRFIPDHFVTQVLSNGSFAHGCANTNAAKSFTYNGQPLSYGASTHPMLSVYAYNTSAITQNYTGNFARLTAGLFSLTAPTTDAVQKGVDNSNLLKLTAALATPGLTDNGNGSLTLILGNDVFTYQRENNALIAPFSNSIAVTVSSVTDLDGVAATTLPMSLKPAGENIRYGRVNLMNANGSELVDLSVPMLAEYFNGSSFITNTDDQCSVASVAISDALSSDALLPANTCIWDTNGLSGGAKCTTAAPAGESYVEGASLAAGSFNLYLKAPGQTGPLSVTATVANWLTYNWQGAGAVNPSATATFGIYKGNSKLIFFKEVY